MYPKIEIAKQFSINKINGGNSCSPVIFLGGNRPCQRIIVIFFLVVFWKKYMTYIVGARWNVPLRLNVLAIQLFYVLCGLSNNKFGFKQKLLRIFKNFISLYCRHFICRFYYFIHGLLDRCKPRS